jgi:hypothetical protein
MLRSYNGTPYTYLIGWTKHNKFYYGVRFAKKCNPTELWKTYFTSSKHVSDFASIYGDPDIIQVRKTFKHPKAARSWEHKVLRRIKAVSKINFLNKTDNISIQNSKEHYAYLSQHNSITQKGKPKNFSKEDLDRRSKLQSAMNKVIPRDGKNNSRYDFTIYTFKNRKTNEVFVGHRYDFINRHGLNKGNVSSVINGNIPHCKNWVRIR